MASKRRTEKRTRVTVGTFNLFNLTLPGVTFYGRQRYSKNLYRKMIEWRAAQLDKMDADFVGCQEVFAREALVDVVELSQKMKGASVVVRGDDKQHPVVGLISKFPVLRSRSVKAIPKSALLSEGDVQVSVSEFSRPVLQAVVDVQQRFSAYRLAGDEKTILAASFDPKLVQLDDGARVTEEVLQVPIIDPACPADSRFHSLPLSRWPLRIPPSQSLVVDGDALRDRFIQFSDADKIGRAWFPELDFVKLGTNKSLGLLGFPGSIKMVNHARRDEVTMGEDFKQTFLGVWNDEIFGKRDGSHLKLTFTREGGALSKRFVTITNKGDIAIALKFTPRSGIEEDS